MSRRFLVALLALAASQGRAQTPESFLAMVPALPQTARHCPTCGGDETTEARARFATEARAVAQRMQASLDTLEDREREAAKKAQQKLAEGMGAPPEGADSRKKGSRKDRQAAADRALAEQFGAGTSSEELKRMSPEERRAWAMALAAGGGAMGDPSKYQKAAQRAQEGAQAAPRMAALNRELQAQAETFRTRWEALRQEYRELTKPAGRDYSSDGGVGCEERRKACRAVLPKVAALFKARLEEIRANGARCRELETLNARQAGLEAPAAPGLLQMKQVHTYVEDLAQALEF